MSGAVLAGTWWDRARDSYDRILASPGFRRWAASFPATRPVARRRAQALFDLCAGFVYSQVLQACVQLNLFEILADGPKSAAALALRCGLPQDGAMRLLEAAVGVRLLSRRRGGRYGLGPLGAAMVDNAAVTSMVAHHTMLYADLADPLALLRNQAESTALSRYWAYGGGDSAPYSALMAASQTMVAQEVLDAYDVRRHRVLLDVGGGAGAFVSAALQRAPDLRAIVFDVPSVVARLQLGDRVTGVGGDFHGGALPRGADLVSLIRVVHDHDDGPAQALLASVRAALPDGGTVLLAEPMAGTRGAETVGSYFEFYLMAMRSGRPRTRAELTAMLLRAGFSTVRHVPTSTPMVAQVLVANVNAS